MQLLIHCLSQARRACKIMRLWHHRNTELYGKHHGMINMIKGWYLSNDGVSYNMKGYICLTIHHVYFHWDKGVLFTYIPHHTFNWRMQYLRLHVQRMQYLQRIQQCSIFLFVVFTWRTISHCYYKSVQSSLWQTACFTKITWLPMTE